ncbi:hypothetical protein T484DRAFT_2589156, partial [Baffinella frigidus]
DDGCSPLHYASRADSCAAIAAAIVAAGGNALLQDFSGTTPTELARQRGSGAMLSALGYTLTPAPAHVDSLLAGAPGERDDDLITGRGEVWVARPFCPAPPAPPAVAPAAAAHTGQTRAGDAAARYGEPPAALGAQSGQTRGKDRDWGLRTVELRSPNRSPPEAGAAARGGAAGMGAAGGGGVRPGGGGEAAGGHAQPNPNRALGFATWERRDGKGGGRPGGPGGPGGGKVDGSMLEASYVDLTRSVVEDWIVVDSSDDEQQAGAGGKGGRSLAREAIPEEPPSVWYAYTLDPNS